MERNSSSIEGDYNSVILETPMLQKLGDMI